jgi:succinyl-diaminopimelate desuccinylase
MEVHELKRRIMKHVRALGKDMLTFTEDLIRVQTENPPGSAYKDCVDLIAAKLVQFGVKPRIIRVRSGTALHPRYCLIASHGSGSKVLYFHGHYDVVPAAGKHQFEPVIRNSR